MTRIFRSLLSIRLFDDRAGLPRLRAFMLLGGLAVLNLAVWAAAWAVFAGHPVLLGTAALAYGFGLRHAFDVDHIAAIDNATRKLMQEGKRPLGTGFFFSLGHSTVVIAMTVLVVLAAGAVAPHIEAVKAAGGTIGTSISAAFLLAVAIANLVTLVALWRGRAAHDGAVHTHGFLARLLRRPLALIGRSWHLYPLGFLFGLGFDTATEVGLLALSAAAAAKGLPVAAVLLFPALFAAAMVLADTLDGVVMLEAYDWALRAPARRFAYNLAVTGLSVAVALAVSGVEIAGLVADHFGLRARLWQALAGLDVSLLGIATAGLFVALWLVSLAAHRWRAARTLDNRAGAQ